MTDAGRRREKIIDALNETSATPRQAAYRSIEDVAIFLAQVAVRDSFYGRSASEDDADYKIAERLTETLATIRALDELEDVQFRAQIEELESQVQSKHNRKLKFRAANA